MSSRKRTSHGRSSGQRRSSRNSSQVREALNWFLQTGSLKSLSFHGNTSWLPSALITQALLWTWSAAPTLSDAFEEARSQSQQLLGRAALSTYQGLMGALQTWTATFIPLLQVRIHQLLEEMGGKHLRVARWCAIAVDGSRLSTPRTVSNEAAFCAPNYGRGQTAKYRKKKTTGMRRKKNAQAKAQPQGPQIWVTLLWHIGLGVPWCWKLGPSNSSERQHAMDLIGTGHFLKNTLFVGDAGFVGFDFWRWILAHKHHFLVRVGGNVSLLRELGYHVEQRAGQKGRVSCWPSSAMDRKLPPLELRLVKAKLGRKKVWLLTSVLDAQQLTPQEMLCLYKLRWGVELEFRGLKQTFARRELRSRTSQRALAELEWSLLGMTILELFALKQQLPERGSDPKKLSFAKSLQAVRRSLQHLDRRPEHQADFRALLKAAAVDDYERKKSKTARYQPHKKDKPSCGQPKVSLASAEHRQRLKALPETNLRAAA